VVGHFENPYGVRERTSGLTPARAWLSFYSDD
jgi:hypothetical protein